MSWFYYIGFLTYLLCLPLKTLAIDADYSVGLSIGKYDNIDLVAEPLEKETSYNLNAGLSVSEDASNLYLNIRGIVNSINYVNDVVEDRTSGDLVANVIWRIKPGHFEWYLDNTFTQSLIDTLDSDSPENRENINVFSTGPNYIVRLSARNNLQFEARAQNYNYERNFDNNRSFTAARWIYNVNSAFTLSLNSEAELVRFKDDLVNNDFDRYDSFLGLDYLRGTTEFNAEYGSTNIVNEIIPDNSVERYLLAISSIRSSSTTIRLDYENLLSDTGRQASNLTSSQIGNDSPLSAVNNDLFIDQTIRLQYIKNYSDNNITYQLFTGEREYNIRSDLDVEVDGIYINGRWLINSRDFVLFNLRYVQNVYLDPTLNREDEDYRYAITYNHRLQRQINVGLELISLERESNIEDSSYEDFRMILTLNYSSL